jgi:alkaline phosphatase
MKKHTLLSMMWLLILPLIQLQAQENYKDKDLKNEFQNEDFHDVKLYSPNELTFEGKPKNIVLLIGDGMGVSQVFAGMTANKGQLFLQNFKHIG